MTRAGRWPLWKGVAAICTVGVLAVGCIDRAPEGATMEPDGPAPELARCETAPSFEVDEVARGLEVVWDFAVAPDGRVFVTERPGRIRVIEEGVLRDDPWFDLEVEQREEAGLLGITLGPDFEQTGHLFVASSHVRPPPAGGVPVLSRVLAAIRARTMGDGGTTLVNRIHRVTDVDGAGADLRVWVDALPSGILHAGGALLTLPEEGLFLSLGDGMDPWRAQQASSLRGSILRIPTRDPPPSNRLRAGTHAVALGVRNSQGLAFLDRDSSTVVFTDHGSDRRDELNELRIGGNFGWPAELGRVDEPRFVPPMVEWPSTVAPAGIAVGRGLAPGDTTAATARVWVTGLAGRTLREIRVQETDGGWAALCEVSLIEGEYGRLRAIAVAPGGGLYLGTSNRDGRAVPESEDDRILHLRWESNPED